MHELILLLGIHGGGEEDKVECRESRKAIENHIHVIKIGGTGQMNETLIDGRHLAHK